MRTLKKAAILVPLGFAYLSLSSPAAARDDDCPNYGPRMSFEIMAAQLNSGDRWASLSSRFVIVNAVGQICRDTPYEFERFSNSVAEDLSLKSASNPRSILIVFKSKGGSSVAATELGRMIRNLGGSTTFIQHCDSACIYAFAGGINRYWPEDGEAPNGMGIHRLSFAWGEADEPNQDELLELIGRMQYYSSLLSQYLREMGIDYRLFDTSTQYGDPMFEMGQLIAKNFKLINADIKAVR